MRYDAKSSLPTPNREPRLLYSRQQVAQLLGGVDISFIRRLEKAMRLKPVRLTRSPTAMVFFRAEDVMALVQEATNAN